VTWEKRGATEPIQSDRRQLGKAAGKQSSNKISWGDSKVQKKKKEGRRMTVTNTQTTREHDKNAHDYVHNHLRNGWKEEEATKKCICLYTFLQLLLPV